MVVPGKGWKVNGSRQLRGEEGRTNGKYQLVCRRLRRRRCQTPDPYWT